MQKPFLITLRDCLKNPGRGCVVLDQPQPAPNFQPERLSSPCCGWSATQPRSFFRLALNIAFAILLGGCAYIPQTATLKVHPNIVASDAGRGVTVAVRIIDRRPSSKIGHRGVDSENALITTKGSVEPLFQNAVMQGLARKGFTSVRFEGQSVRLLTVEVRRIDYATDMEYWKGIVRTEATLNASMVKDGVKFEQLYTGKRMETTMEAPRATTNERLINGAISDAVERMFEDEALIRYLSE